MPDCRIDHLHVARKTSCEEPCFGWLETINAGPLFALAGYSCTWKVRSNVFELLRD